MQKVENITKDEYQKHTLIYEDLEVEIELRFMPVVESWTLNVKHGDKVQTGIRCSLGVYLLKDYNFAFDLIFLDTDKLGIDPFRLEDFADNRIQLWFATPSECEEIRGYKIEME